LRLPDGFDPVSGKGFDKVMSVQLRYSHFPVREAEMKARIEYGTLVRGESVQSGSATGTPCMLNHPVIDFGYRIKSHEKSVFSPATMSPSTTYTNLVTRDTTNIRFLSMKKWWRYTKRWKALTFSLRIALTPMLSTLHRGWRHGTITSNIVNAELVRAKVLFCSHHEPTRSDGALKQAFQTALLTNYLFTAGMDIRLARVGETYEF
jgi:hypothetical protein